jgi:hypothetical protein
MRRFNFRNPLTPIGWFFLCEAVLLVGVLFIIFH